MNDYLTEQMEELNLTAASESFTKLFPGYQIDMNSLFNLILEGQAGEAFKMITQAVKEGFAGDLAGMKTLLVSILLIGIFSALLSDFSDVLAKGNTRGTGFYLLYLILLSTLTGAFTVISRIAVATFENIILFVKLFVPSWAVSVSVSLGTTTASFYYGMMLLLVWGIEEILLSVMVPFIYSYVILALLSALFPEERLNLLLDFMKRIADFAFKVMLALVTGMSFVQALIIPAVDGLKVSAMKKAMQVLPGIGGAVEGVAELVLGSAVLIRNTMGILFLVLLLLICALPVFKILVLSGLIRFGAALCSVVGDKRLSGCVDKVGEGCFLLLRCVLTGMALFLIVVAIVSCIVRCALYDRDYPGNRNFYHRGRGYGLSCPVRGIQKVYQADRWNGSGGTAGIAGSFPVFKKWSLI